MSRIEELPDDYQDPPTSHLPKDAHSSIDQTPIATAAAEPGIVSAPALPPYLASARNQSVDEVLRDLKRTPFFATSLDDLVAPDPSASSSGEVNNDLEAIKALMYEGPRSEQAENFREQGNELVRVKKWADGKEAYSKGLLALRQARKEGDIDGEEEDAKEKRLEEVLRVNRALCHLELQNYRSCTLDCIAGLTLNPTNVKAHFRLSTALFRLKKFPEARAACTAALTQHPTNEPLKTLQAKILTELAAAEKKEKARQESEAREKQKRQVLGAALTARGIRVRKSAAGPPADLPEDATLSLHPDPLLPTSTLVFPVVVLYPLHAQSDMVKQFGELETPKELLVDLLPPPWDNGEYRTPQAVDVYLETKDGEGLVKWGKNVELLRVIGEEGKGKVEVVDGIVRVSVVPKARSAEFIERLRERKKKK